MEDNHDRVIVHIDIDCFYAQVEMIKRPELKDKPMGIQQKNIVVTCNYPARARGVGKCMYITEAKEKCPELELVNGEDLAEYRRVSASVYSTLCETGCPVERLGMDENWLDVTQIVKLRLMEPSDIEHKLRGNTLGELQCEECDCVQSLKIGSIVAEEIRESLKQRHGLTASAGIAHNKMLSKLVGSKNKPDNQTTISSSGIFDLLKADNPVTSIPGIGRKAGDILSSAGIMSLKSLRESSVDQLIKTGIARSQAEIIKDLSWGRDSSEVKMSGKPASVGLEDRFTGIYQKEGCREKLKWLLGRLVQLLAEDGRKPTNIKVTVRDYYKDKIIKKFHKESRQIRISPRLFQLEGGQIKDDCQEEILDICMGLLAKMIDFKDSFLITLMGLAVTDFLEQMEKKSSIKHFFISPKKDGMPSSVPTEDVQKKKLFKEDLNPGKRKSQDFFQIGKRPKNTTESTDTNENIVCSVSKQPEAQQTQKQPMDCPKGFDPDVWFQLPMDIKKEMLSNAPDSGQNQCFSMKNKTSESEGSSGKSETEADPTFLPKNDKTEKLPESKCSRSFSESDNDANCPPEYDKDIFCQLPADIREELKQQHSSVTAKQIQLQSTRRSPSQSRPKNKTKSSNSILNYFTKK